MLTQTMTHAEVYAELDRDRETATVWWRHHLDTLRRPVLKARRMPVIHWADYTSPRRQHILTDSEMYERAKEWYK